MKASAQTPLVAEPAALTPDTGPRHRAGLFTWFIFISCTLAAFGIALLLYQKDGLVWPLAALLGFVVIAIFAAVRLLASRRCHEALPASHDVLVGTLGFELHYTSHDVAATAFLHSDRVSPGHPTQLLCFVENYASRQRVAHFRIGPHPDLGLPAVHPVALQLAAGQAAVYILPLEVSRSLSPGAHDRSFAAPARLVERSFCRPVHVVRPRHRTRHVRTIPRGCPLPQPRRCRIAQASSRSARGRAHQPIPIGFAPGLT